MKPVWIKYYGLIPMTRFGYLLTLGIACLCAALGLIALALAGRLPPFSTLWEPDPAVRNAGAGGWMYNHLFQILLVCLLAQIIDTLATLRAFAKKEAEQRALLEQDFD